VEPFAVTFCLPTARDRYIDVLRTWDSPDIEFFLSYELDNPDLHRLTQEEKESFRGTFREFEHSCSQLGGNVPVWNALAKEVNTDAMMLLGDDVYNLTPNWREIIIKKIPNFPNEPWAVVGDDLLVAQRTVSEPPRSTWDRKLAGHPLLTKKYYKLFDYAWNPGYTSQFCDDEFYEVGIGIERLVYIPEWVYDNRHPVVGKSSIDKWCYIARDMEKHKKGKEFFSQKDRINNVIQEAKRKINGEI
jgi:hypothetical protein